MKQFIAILLVLCMVCGILPFSAMAEEVLLEEEFLLSEDFPVPEFEEDLFPEEPDSEPLPEELPNLPAELEEVPLPRMWDETAAFETKYYSGTVYASDLRDNDAIFLRDDTELIMDVPRTLEFIEGQGEDLSIKGDCMLRIRHLDGIGIYVRSLGCYAPLDIESHRYGIIATRGDIVIRNDLTVNASEGSGLYTMEGDVNLLGGTVKITTGVYSCIYSKHNITLSGDITVTSENVALYCTISETSGTITILDGTITLINTGPCKYDGDKHTVECNNLQILGGTVTASALSDPLWSRNSLTIQPPLVVLYPENGEVAQVNGYYTVVDSKGNSTRSIKIGDPDPVPPVEKFVRRCYKLILDREGDPDGIAFWVNALKTHQAAGADIVAQFCKSPEFQSRRSRTVLDEWNKTIVWILYHVMLDREPDDEGRNFWHYNLDCGCSCNLIVAGFAGSAEFKKICDQYGIVPGTVGTEPRDQNVQVTKFVNRCYYLTLDRYGSDEPEGLNYWVSQMLSYVLTPQQVAENFLRSKEFNDRTPSNEAYVTALYRLYMGHAPEPTGFAYWVDLLNNGTPRATVAETFGNTPEFLAIVQGLGL